jgi:hypothetical protein
MVLYYSIEDIKTTMLNRNRSMIALHPQSHINTLQHKLHVSTSHLQTLRHSAYRIKSLSSQEFIILLCTPDNSLLHTHTHTTTPSKKNVYINIHIQVHACKHVCKYICGNVQYRKKNDSSV